MKKITALIMSALMLTIGGVYATWTYAQGDVTEASVYIKQNIKMADLSKTNAKGTITVDFSTVEIVVDDTDETDVVGDHHACLKVAGTIKITFTPAKGADSTVNANGIKMQMKVELSDDMKYTDANGVEKSILVVTNTDWQILNSGNATKEITVNAADVLNLELGGDFYLPTYADYEAFRLKLNSTSVHIVVDEIPAAQ